MGPEYEHFGKTLVIYEYLRIRDSKSTRHVIIAKLGVVRHDVSRRMLV